MTRPARFLRRNPFLTAGLVGTFLFGLWIVLDLDPRDGGIGAVLFHTWRILAAPVHFAANFLSPYTDSWPDALDAGAAVAVGLVPYLAADVIWRRLRKRLAADPST